MAGRVLSQYNLGCTPRELFYRCEYWEILGLLYFTFEKNVLEKQEMEIQGEIQEINRKFQEGKLRTFYKPGMHPRVREHINKLIGKGR